MNYPFEGDYIDIHVHGGKTKPGVFILETLMAHENRLPDNIPGIAYTFGIHPWYLTHENYSDHLRLVERIAAMTEIVAIGEAGFDKLHGPSMELQAEVFSEQVKISERINKPLIIHCVRAWDELLSAARTLKPKQPWMIHGFRGKIKLAEQLLSKGFRISIWFEYALRPESTELLRNLPEDSFFLETDGADIRIESIYEKVADDKGIDIEYLKTIMCSNYLKFFNLGSQRDSC
ncbi:MAG TPA: TatD family hydrolase [Bacteroidales bacterium]|nr:TatD family hydrolase [Bacteroidales bacterium]